MDERPLADENMMPLGMAMSLAMDTTAMRAFSQLSPEEQDTVMSRARNVGSKSEMDALIRDIPHFSD